MPDPTPEQIRDHVCPYDGAHCPEFQNELDARRKQAESLGIRFRENMFVYPGEDFFAECPNINKDGFNCARYNMWLKKQNHGK
ncbi:MAG: hypothetical protein J5620_03645 [Alphaproteobacteria bacterium]|nr:hypothetical protein [Alphaproteobacteria bacterium]